MRCNLVICLAATFFSDNTEFGEIIKGVGGGGGSFDSNSNDTPFRVLYLPLEGVTLLFLYFLKFILLLGIQSRLCRSSVRSHYNFKIQNFVGGRLFYLI